MARLQQRRAGPFNAGLLFKVATVAALLLTGHYVLVQATAPGSGGVPDAAFFSALSKAGLVTQANGLQVAEYCQQPHADELAKQAVDLLHKGWSSCPSNDWLRKFQEISTPGLNRTFIDIGCNKGYTSASFFALFAPAAGFSPKSILGWNPSVNCGSCDDCQEEWVPAGQPPAGKQPGIQVLCVEPNLPSFAELIRIREHFFAKNGHPTAVWHLVNGAISNSTSRVVTFPRCLGGDEVCGFEFGTNQGEVPLGYDTVPLWGVDQLIDNYGLQYVDVLKLDTEGYDVPAIASAMTSLLGRKIGILTFEYHGVGVWWRHSLEHLVERLDGLNFACYLSGQKGEDGSSISRLTGCWAGLYEFHSWSNVVCVRRDHELYPHAERLSTRYTKHRQLYFRE